MAGFVEFGKWRRYTQRRIAQNDLGGLRSIEECPDNNELLATSGSSKFPSVHCSEISLDVVGPNFFQVTDSGSLLVFEKVLGVSAISNPAMEIEVARPHLP